MGILELIGLYTLAKWLTNLSYSEVTYVQQPRLAPKPKINLKKERWLSAYVDSERRTNNV